MLTSQGQDKPACRIFSLQELSEPTDTHTHPVDCSTRATKVVGKTQSDVCKDMSPCCVKGNAPSPSICDPDWCLLVAKFHYTGPTGPDRTFLRPGSPRNSVGSVRVSDKVRSA